MPSDFVQTQVSSTARGRSGEVVGDPRLEAVAGEQRGHRSAWSWPISTAASPPGSSRRGQLRRQRAIGVEALLAGEQRLVGLIFAHAGAELGAFGDIGRVAQDQVEALDQPFGPVARISLTRPSKPSRRALAEA